MVPPLWYSVVMLLCIAVGLQLLLANNGGHTRALSYFIQTTRSPELDRLAVEDETKRQSGVKAGTLARVRLHYGYLDLDNPNAVLGIYPRGYK